jgi:hypothetical protein
MQHRAILDDVSLENHDAIEVVRQDSRGHQSRDAASDDEGAIAETIHIVAIISPVWARRVD